MLTPGSMLGGRYQLKGNAGGTITACEPPRHLALTWEMRGDVSWVDVTLKQIKPQQTQLTLEHVAFVPEAIWDEYGPGGVGVGWDLGLWGLELHLAAPETDNSGAQAWTTSPEGVSFQRGLNDSWCEASIAYGTPPEAARAAAERTSKFYTGDS